MSLAAYASETNKNCLRSQKFVYNISQLVPYAFWLAPATMILASFSF